MSPVELALFQIAGGIYQARVSREDLPAKKIILRYEASDEALALLNHIQHMHIEIGRPVIPDYQTQKLDSVVGVLNKHHGNLTKAAKELNIKRTTLLAYIRTIDPNFQGAGKMFLNKKPKEKTMAAKA